MWPELLGPIHLYALYSSQWRPDYMGLDLGVFQHALDRMDLTPTQYNQWMSDLRTIEGAARIHLTKPA